jgi:hypothetical protein
LIIVENMGKPVDKEKRRKAARKVVARALEDGQRLKNVKGLRDLLAEEIDELNLPEDHFSVLTVDDLASLLCEALDNIAPQAHAVGSPPPPVPIAPQNDSALGLSHVGPHTTIGPGNILTPAPSQQEGQGDGHKDPCETCVGVDDETDEERCTEEVPQFEENVSN